MRVQILVEAADESGVVLGFTKTDIIYPDTDGDQRAVTRNHLLDVYSAVTDGLEEATEKLRTQAERLGISLGA